MGGSLDSTEREAILIVKKLTDAVEANARDLLAVHGATGGRGRGWNFAAIAAASCVCDSVCVWESQLWSLPALLLLRPTRHPHPSA